MEESTPETYTFSEPRVVLSAPNSMFYISEWLPDSQNVLIKRTVVEKMQTKYDSIELFDPVRVKTRIYAKLEPPTSYGLPVWMSGLNGVLYQKFIAEPASYNANGEYIPPSNEIAHMLLLLSNGDPDNTQTIDDSQYNHHGALNVKRNWVTSSIAVKPDGSEIVYLKADNEVYQFYRRELSQGQFGEGQPLPISADMLKNHTVTRYKMAWRPYTKQIFFMGSNDYQKVQAFLFDIDTENFCTLDFGTSSWNSKQWAWLARWSPNGRYLALIRGGTGFPIDFSDLAVLDTATGKLYTMAFSPDVAGRHYVWDIAWAPDNRHLAAIGMVSAHHHCAPDCMESVNRLYLVDFMSGKADLIFPSFQFSSGNVGENLAWSPDGTKILAQCRTEKMGRLCYIPVQVGGQ